MIFGGVPLADLDGTIKPKRFAPSVTFQKQFFRIHFAPIHDINPISFSNRAWKKNK